MEREGVGLAIEQDRVMYRAKLARRLVVGVRPPPDYLAAELVRVEYRVQDDLEVVAGRGIAV